MTIKKISHFFNFIKTNYNYLLHKEVKPKYLFYGQLQKKRERDKLGSVNLRADEETFKYEEEIKKMKEEAEANAESDKKAKDQADKLNSADQMIFQTESQLKEFGDKLSDSKKKPIEVALDELKKAYSAKDIALIDPALAKINDAWKCIHTHFSLNRGIPQKSYGGI